MSTTTPASDPEGGRDAGYSLLEVLIVLLLMAVAAALVMPSGRVVLDRALAHAVYFDFQRQVSDQRLRAWRAESPAVIDNAGPVRLRAGWRYQLDRPIRIDEGGACSPAEALLFKGERRVMRLRLDDPACRFQRLD